MHSADETSTFAEPALPSCGYLHISISSAQHRRGAVDVRLKYTDVEILAHTFTRTRTRSLSTFRFHARVRVISLSVCARRCVAKIQRRKFRCHGQPLPPRDITSVSTYTDTELFRDVLVYLSMCIKPRYVCTHISAMYTYRQLETLLVPLPQLYYLRPYYKSHFAGHSSLFIVPVHFNFRPRCKFHLCVVPDKPVPTPGLPYTITDDVWVWPVDESAGGSFRFNSLRKP